MNFESFPEHAKRCLKNTEYKTILIGVSGNLFYPEDL